MPQTIPPANTYQTHNNAQGQRGHASSPTTKCVVESGGGRLDALCIRSQTRVSRQKLTPAFYAPRKTKLLGEANGGRVPRAPSRRHVM